jgi:hypothetical protein
MVTRLCGPGQLANPRHVGAQHVSRLRNPRAWLTSVPGGNSVASSCLRWLGSIWRCHLGARRAPVLQPRGGSGSITPEELCWALVRTARGPALRSFWIFFQPGRRTENEETSRFGPARALSVLIEIRTEALDSGFDAFSSREPVSTSLENAIGAGYCRYFDVGTTGSASPPTEVAATWSRACAASANSRTRAM